MRNEAAWQPSKYVQRGGRWRASTNPREVSPGSRLMVDCNARVYEAHMARFARGRLLDLGAGKAPLYGLYRPHVTDVVCVDWAASMHASPYLDYEFDLTQPIPLDAASFDTILCSDVLEHLPNPDEVWREMARLLRPGGVALVNVPFLYQLHEQPHDYYRYTSFALRRFIERAEMEVEHLEPLGGSFDVLADFLAKHFKRVPVVGVPVAVALQAGVRAFGATALGGRLRHQTAQQFPLGYFVAARKPAAP